MPIPIMEVYLRILPKNDSYSKDPLLYNFLLFYVTHVTLLKVQLAKIYKYTSSNFIRLKKIEYSFVIYLYNTKLLAFGFVHQFVG